MVFADIVCIVGIVIFAFLGAIFGFGKMLKFLTSGIFGIIISVVICYFVFGMVYNIPFVQSLLERFKEALVASDKPIVRFFLTIRVDIVVYAIVLFIVVSVARIVIVEIIKHVMEVQTTVMKIVNKTFGVILGVALFVGIGLIVMQIMYWSGDGTAPEQMAGSSFRLDYIFTHNPMTNIEALWS